ncbi:hypothetical protein FN846DRAFT_788271 [Sphaerosporella brunnea]|uniref:Peptidase S1 domain-containing protein n=1 Tax=Sphaerosporella brunnea TaxID=1250544 RepID=A0A5J5ED99_9PEZI|nr:hypothetical protein FN846DRAFT_788271 [Sphaerosporella brunnea]
MLLSGSKVGTVVGGSFTHDTVFLQDHNEELRSQGKSQFVLPENLKPTALDWLIFQAEPSRIGGNFNMQARIAEHIRRIGYLAPGNHVFKFGRTTELTRGKVSAFVLFKWEFDETTHEIAVVGTQQLPFARKGDSGAAIMISSDPEDLMGGILIGADLYARLAVVTPFNILLQSISQTFNRQFKFADLADMEESEN